MTAPMDLHVTGSESLAPRLIAIIAADIDRPWWGHVTYRASTPVRHQPLVSGFIRPAGVALGDAIVVVDCNDPDDIARSESTLVPIADIISVHIPC